MWRISRLMFLLLGSLSLQAQTDVVLLGTVVDSQGRPAMVAMLCSQWHLSGPADSIRPLGPSTTTNASGAFKLERSAGTLDVGSGLVFSQDRREGAVFHIGDGEQPNAIHLRLAPLREIRFILRSRLPITDDDLSGHLWVDDKLPIGAIWGTEGVLHLPPGDFHLHVGSGETRGKVVPLHIANRNLVLAPVKLNLLPMPEHYGRGTPKMSELVDITGRPYNIALKPGRWTLLYFWQTTCAPCVSEGIPKLMAFTKAHAGDSARFSIVAIHTNDPSQTESEFLTRTLGFEARLWGGAPDFPLVLDKVGKMTTDWAIQSLPTVALIDARGNLIKNGSLEKLDEVLAPK
jgi:thiol-disulfide isomerase/thioredoxin